MYPDAINKKTARVLEKIGASQIAKDFYLAGGTALALQIGHRQSIDLDWFSRQDFSGDNLKKTLSELGSFEVISEAPGTLHGLLDNVRVSFFYYDYTQLFPFLAFGKINLADERDIAAMKFSAVSSRGGKKDFLDIYFLLQKYELGELFNFFEKKYKNIKYNKLHILKSLTYFDEAETDPMPIMLHEANWETIKKALQEKIKEFLKRVS